MDNTVTHFGLMAAQAEGMDVSAANIILSSGKFEHEHVSVLYFYDLYMSGLHDDESYDGIITFKLDAKESEEFDGQREYRMAIDDNGFVHGNI